MKLGYSNEQRMSDENTTPITNDANLPTMDDKVKAAEFNRDTGGEQMTAAEQITAAEHMPAKKGEGKFMESFTPPNEAECRESAEPKDEYPAQDDPIKEYPDDDEAGEGYVRLRLLVENGEMKVVGARAVAGPLLREQAVHGELAYEIRIGRQRIALGTIPDVGEIRSFPPPNPTPETHGHHIVESANYEFTVRIPRQQFTRETINDLEIHVIRTKGELDVRQFSPEAPAAHQQDSLRTVAKLSGLTPNVLTDGVSKQIANILGGKSTQ